MSYCRFSTSDFACMLYCYANVHGGYTTHVAANKVIFKEPLPPEVELKEGNYEAYAARMAKIHQMIDEGERVPIGLPYDGETFHDTLDGFKKRVKELVALGYVVPQECLENIYAETDENDNPTPFT